MTMNNKSHLTVLRVDASARKSGSITRDFTNRFIETLSADRDVAVLNHDVAEGLPFITEDWVGANFTPADARTEEQRQHLAISDKLIEDIKASDVLAIGVPVYNFSVPATLKAWIDMIARAGVTFKYTENGPVGLLTGKKAVLFVASGGTPVGAAYDYATTYMRHVLGFVGITDVTIVAADKTAVDAEASLKAAEEQLEGAVTEFRQAA
ncbi:FMN-dependent NADH-azoreductase [Kordiimonas aestuarii]|uniref:FMN-dependent NADH-azoreductase n=1 Tax=Kordiimonas aestuarii TaxID=1005925 RepID=UPI00374DA75A